MAPEPPVCEHGGPASMQEQAKPAGTADSMAKANGRKAERDMTVNVTKGKDLSLYQNVTLVPDETGLLDLPGPGGLLWTDRTDARHTDALTAVQPKPGFERHGSHG